MHLLKHTITIMTVMNLNSCFFILSLLQRWRIFKCSNCKNKSIIDSLLKVALRCLEFKTPFPVDSRSLVDFLDDTSGKELLCQCKRLQRLRSDPGLGRSPRGGHHSPLQCSCLENPMDRGAWRATVRGVAKSWTRLR